MWSDEEAVKSAVDMVAEKLGGLDILVNNAGQGASHRFEDMTNELVDFDFSVKVKGTIFMTRHALPYLKRSECGAICNITTAAGKASPGGAQPTSLSRAAGISLTKAWSKEVRGAWDPRQHGLHRVYQESSESPTLGSGERERPVVHVGRPLGVYWTGHTARAHW